MELAKAREYQEVIHKLNQERLQFHDDLRRLLRAEGEGAGDEIKALCEKYGRDTLPGLEKAVALVRSRTAAKLNRGDTIELMRRYGMPETIIFDYLANELDHYRNMRGGPRDRNEVRVRAARLLLTYPPTTPKHG